MKNSGALRSAKPLFLIGAPRSGTTVLMRMLNAHPKILLTNETAVFLQLDSMIQNSRRGAGAGILYGKAYHRLWADNLREQSGQLIERYYEQIATRENKATLKYWGEKHPHLSACLPFLSDLYANAVYVYAIRDPRDVACSIAEMKGITICKAIDTWKISVDKYEKFVGSLTSERLRVVNYEQLVSGYESTLVELFGALGLECDDATMKRIVRYRHKDSHRPNSLGRHDFARKSVGRWSREITGEEYAYVRVRCSDFLEKYGYRV